MRRHDLTEIDLRDGNQRICLRRGGIPLTASGVAPVTLAPVAAPPPPATTSTANQPTAEAGPAKKLIEIRSEAVGTFYARPKPDAAPYVTKGSRVTPITVICQIEAMKTFTEVTADCSGVIADILVENQQPVDYNQVLFLVDPTG